MKVVQSPQGFQILISNEQHVMLNRFKLGEPILKRQLSEREQILAHELTKAGVLTRCEVDRKLAYYIPDPSQIWRI